MDLIKCPRCGEEYSSSYPVCPFCEEDGDSPRKLNFTPTRRVSDRKKTPSARGGLIAVLVLVLVLLSWYLFGDSIIRRGDVTESPEGPQPTQTAEPSVPAVNDDPFYQDPTDAAPPDDESGAAGSVTTDPATTEPDPVEPAIDENVDVSNAKLNRSDFTLSYAGETFRMKVSGTEAAPRWSIDNANVATLAADGTVTAVANGTTTVRCKVGTRELTCVVRVINTGKTAAAADASTVVEPAAPSTSTAPSTPSTPDTPTPTHVDASSLKVKTNYGTVLQKDPGTGYPDCTVRIGGDPISLVVTGTDVPVSGWASDKTSVVTVDASGRLTPVSAGTAHVTATVGDAKITCIIRVR